MNYRVGQILFVIPREKMAVIPVQVIEEITKKSLKGQHVSYIIRYGQDPNKTVDIGEIDGEIYDSSDQVKMTLIERSTVALNRLVNTAVEKAKGWYSGAFENPTPVGGDELSDALMTKPRDGRGRFVPSAPEDDGTSDASVTLEDGTVMKVRLPPELQD